MVAAMGEAAVRAQQGGQVGQAVVRALGVLGQAAAVAVARAAAMEVARALGVLDEAGVGAVAAAKAVVAETAVDASPRPSHGHKA